MHKLIFTACLGLAFFASNANQFANANPTGGTSLNALFGPGASTYPAQPSTRSGKYAVYAYDVYYSYPVYRNGRKYTASGRYTSTFSSSSAARIRANLLAKYRMNVWISKRFWRWSYNR